MAEIVWTKQAIEDVESICEYIAGDSPHYAKLFANHVFETAKKIGGFPEMGRIVPEINRKEIREHILGNYRIIYRFSQNRVEIVSVYHSARLLDVQKILNN
ncbi:MAG: type II toxin-antitoxin system RelE/ParE family toxin [Calditrichaeota bacterium]|nr:type II toxin-antitoxin system RelE/ParE family toxin [Calditrichota bacterium]